MDIGKNDLGVGVSFDTDIRPILSALAEIKAAMKGMEAALPRDAMAKALADPIKGAVRELDTAVGSLQTKSRQAFGAVEADAKKAGKGVAAALASGMEEGARTVKRELAQMQAQYERTVAAGFKVNIDALQRARDAGVKLFPNDRWRLLDANAEKRIETEATRVGERSRKALEQALLKSASPVDVRTLLGLQPEKLTSSAKAAASVFLEAFKVDEQGIRPGGVSARVLLGLGDTSVARAARESAAVFQREFKLDDQGLRSGGVSTRTLLGLSDAAVSKAAKDSAAVFQREFKLDDTGARVGGVSTRTLLGLSDAAVSKAAKDSAAVFQREFKLDDQGLRAGGVDARKLLGLDSGAVAKSARDSAAVFAREFRLDDQGLRGTKPADAKKILGMPEGDTLLAMRQFYTEQAALAKGTKTLGDENTRLQAILKNTNKIMNDGHSAARGLASGFNAMWLTWGNIAPLLAGAAISNAFVQSAKYGMEVAHTLDIIRNIGGATTAEMARLESTMLSMARNGPAGPLEIAEAMKTLSLAGVRANEVVSATQTVLNFSVAGTTDLKQAADTLVSVSTAFGMGVQGFGRVADVVSKAAAESMVSVESFSQSMKTASVINAQYGVSLEDTATGIAVLSKLGIEGSAAGTALRNMYVDLSGRTEQTSRVLKKFGVELRDANSGGFRPMVEIVTELTAKFNTLDALSQKNLMQALFSERGAKGIVEAMRLVMTSADDMGKGAQNALEEVRINIENSAGFAAITAAKMAQSTENQFKQTQSSLRAAMFEAFREMEPMLLVTMDAMRKAFASPEFKAALEGIVTTVASLTRALTENLGVIVMAVTVYGAAKAAQLALVGAAGAWQGVLLLTGRAVVDETGRIVARTAAVVADTAATQLNTAAKVGNAAAAGGALLGLAKAIPFIGTAVTLATTAWIGYEMWTSRSTDASKAATDNYYNNVVKRLDDESDRLAEVNRLVREGLTLKEADARVSQRRQEGASSRLDEYQRALTEFEVANRARAALKGDTPGRAGAGALDVANLRLQSTTADVQRTYRNLTDDDKRLLESGQRRAAEQKERDATLKREEERRNKDLQALFGKNTFDLSDAKQRGVQRLKTDLGNELSLVEKRYSDEVNTIQQAEQNKKRLLAAEHQNKLITDGEFHARELQLAQDAEAARTALISSYGLERSLKQKAEEAKLRENYGETLKEIDAKFSGKEAVKEREQAAEAFQGALKKLSDEAATFNQRLNNDGKSIEDNVLTRMTMQAYKAAGAIRDVQLKLEDFKRAQVTGKEDADRAEALNDALRNASGGQAEYLRAAASEQEKFISQYRDYDKAILDAEKSLRGYIKALGDEVDLSYEQSAALGQYIDLLDKLKKTRAEIQGGEEAAVSEAGMRALRRYQKDEIKRLSGDTAEALITGLTKGSKQGGKSLRKIIEAELRKPIVMAVQALVQPVVGSIVGSITNSVVGNAAGSAASGASNLLSGVGLIGRIGGNFGMGLNAGLSGVVGEAGLMGSLDAGGIAISSGNVSGGLGTIMGAAAPYLAAAGAIYMIAKSLDDSGTYHTGGAAQYKGGALRTSLGFRDNEEGLPSYNPNDNIDNQFGTGFGYVERGDQTISAVSTLAQSLGTALDGLATSFGKAAGYEVATAFADDSSKDGAWGALRISKDGQELLNWQNTRTSRWAPMEFGDGEEGYKQYLAAVAKDTRQLLLDMDLPGWADNVLQAIGDSPSIESLSTALTQIGEIQTVFVALGKSLNGFTNLTDKAKETLLAASGGAQALAQNATAFYQGYYSVRERISRDTTELTGSFKTLGFTLPRSREELRALIEAQVALGDAGAEAAGKLLALSGAFANVSSATEAAQRAFTENLINLESRFKDGGLSRRRQVESLVPQLSALLSGTSLQESDRALANRMLTGTSDDIEAYFRKVWEVLPNDDARAKLMEVTDAMLSLSEASEEAAKNLADAAIEFAKATARTTEEARYITGLGAVGNRSALQELGMPGVGQTTAMKGDQSTLQSLSNVIVVPAVQAPVIDVVKQAQAAATEQSELLAKQIADTPGLGAALQIGDWGDGWRNANLNFPGYDIPGFADGGYHSGGARLVGERGREIEVTGPSLILNNPITEAILGRSDNEGAMSAAAVAELRGLRADVDNLRYEVRAVAINTGEAASTLRRASPGRDSFQVTLVADETTTAVTP